MVLLSVLAAGILPAPAGAAAGKRVALRVLVVSDGEPEVEAVAGALGRAQVPVDLVDLTDPARPPIEADSLRVPDVVPHARYQAVVLPSEAPIGLAPTELDALHDLEAEFGLRQLNAVVQPSPATGLRGPSAASGWSGLLEGGTARLSRTATSTAFADLRGDIPVDGATRAEIGRPRADYETLLTALGPDGTARGPLMGVHRVDGREELGLSFTYGEQSLLFAALAPGLVTWLTQGVHLGLWRSWFAVHIDDVLLPNARWVPEADCAYGADCPSTVAPVPTIRMTPDDVAFAAAWSRTHRFRLDMAFNGTGALSAGGPRGDDPLLRALVAHRHAFGWINHTWSHPYLGCVRDYSIRPWRCATVPVLGWTRFVREGELRDEIARNVAFARTHDLPLDPAELITGEHGGLRGDEQMPADNPSLADALDAEGVGAIAADASKDPEQRAVGRALTVPRHPIDLDFDTATVAETVDQYNFAHTSTADGGAGTCEADGSCLAPIPTTDPAAGFLGGVVPREADRALRHVLTNDPRPHYVHQPQLAEDRTLYPLLERVLGAYRSVYTDARPLLVPTMSETRDTLAREAAWAAAAPDVRAWTESDGSITIVADAPVAVPVTVPGDGDLDVGEQYGTTRSGWLPVLGERRIAGGRA